MYKNFNLTEKEKKQILEQHKSYGNKKPMNEEEVNNSPKNKLKFSNVYTNYTVKTFDIGVSIIHEKSDNFKDIGDFYTESTFGVIVTINNDEPIIDVNYLGTATRKIFPMDDSDYTINQKKSSSDQKHISIEVPNQNIDGIAENIKQEVSNSYLSMLSGAPKTFRWSNKDDKIVYISSKTW